MGGRIARDDNAPKKINVRQADGSVIPVTIEQVGHGNLRLTREDGSAIITAPTTVDTPVGVKTVLIPLGNPYLGGLSNLVTDRSQQGVVAGVQNYSICAAELPQTGDSKGKSFLPGYTSDVMKGKCEVVWDGKAHRSNHSSVIQDDGQYTWSRAPEYGVSFGEFNGVHRPVCRGMIDGNYYVGSVTSDGRCQFSTAREVHMIDEFDYLDHPNDQV